MSEPSDTVDEFEIRRILNAANAMQRDPRTSKKLREQLHGLIASLVADCSEADRNGDRWALLSVAQTAFAIGAIAGTPAMVTNLQDGRRVAGGMKSGATRRAKALAWHSHATDLMRTIRGEHPNWSRDRVAGEALAQWRSRDVDPPTAPRSLVNLLKKLEASGAMPLRSSETN